MLDIRRDQPGFFAKGIEGISHAPVIEDFSLPESMNTPMSEAGERSHLEALLQKPSKDSRLEAALRPPLESRDLLLPGKFRTALAEARELVRQAAAQVRQDPDKPDDGQAAHAYHVLNRAAALLDMDGAHRDLAQMYRSTLYQG